MLGGLKRRLHQTRLALEHRAEERVARLVKEVTPEGVARRPGESVPVWGFTDEAQRRLAQEIDGIYGNGQGGVDRREVATFREDLRARIEAQRVVLSGCRPGSSAEADAAGLIHRWEAELRRAEAIDQVIQQSDVRLLLDVAQMVQRESSGVIKALAGTFTQAIGQVASQVQVNVAAEVGRRKKEQG